MKWTERLTINFNGGHGTFLDKRPSATHIHAVQVGQPHD